MSWKPEKVRLLTRGNHLDGVAALTPDRKPGAKIYPSRLSHDAPHFLFKRAPNYGGSTNLRSVTSYLRGYISLAAWIGRKTRIMLYTPPPSLGLKFRHDQSRFLNTDPKSSDRPATTKKLSDESQSIIVNIGPPFDVAAKVQEGEQRGV